MEKIASFKIDHRLLKQGIYVSRVDKVNDTEITTYDIRVIEPSKATPEWLEDIGAAFHTIEHIGATYFRGPLCSFSDDVIYFGPMGCLTGFYLILKGNHSHPDVWHEVLKMFVRLETEQIVPGTAPEECGRYTYHDLVFAKTLVKPFVDILNAGVKMDRINYPVGKVVFICAMEEEAAILRKGVSDAGIEALVVVAGIGKVRAALKTAQMIEKYEPNYVVSFGYAGGISDDDMKGHLIEASNVFYHDVWCGEPNKPGQVQGYPQKFKCAERPEITKLMLETVFKDKTERYYAYGSVATGDSFVTSKSDVDKILKINENTKCVDMEAAAVAQVCYDNHVPFMAFKIISDVIGTESQLEDYNDSVNGQGISITAQEARDFEERTGINLDLH